MSEKKPETTRRITEMNQITTEQPQQSLSIVTNGYQGAFSSASNFEAAQRMAKALTSSTLVPKQYQGAENIGNAIIALEMAQRINASPLMVCQNLYVVHGAPGWSAKFLIATFNQCGRFSAIRYRWRGESPNRDYGCQAYTTEKATGIEIEGPWIDWNLVKSEAWDSKSGSKWKTMPQKMFMYRAAAWMIDVYAPEISMGLSTTDQLDDIIDIDPTTGEILNVVGDNSSQAETLNDTIKTEMQKKTPAKTTKKNTVKQKSADKPKEELEVGPTYAEVVEIINKAEQPGDIDGAMGMISHLPEDQQDEIMRLGGSALEKFDQ